MFKIKSYYSGCLLLCFLLPGHSAAESLQQAWHTALNVDHTLKAVQENTIASRHRLKSAKAARLPSISVGVGYTALQDTPASQVNFGGGNIQFPVAENESLAYKAMTVLPIYTSGQIAGHIDAASSALLASKQIESGTVLDLKLQVAETYIAVLRSAKSLEVAESHVSSLIAHANDVKNMHDQGMVSRNDLLAAQVALADARQWAIKAGNILDISRSAYNRLLARPLKQTVELDELQVTFFDQSLASLTNQAIKKRYELQVLLEQAKALSSQAKAIRAQSGPQVALSGGYDYQQNQYQVHEGQWLLNLGMQWKIFDAGLIKNRASATERQSLSLKQQYDDTLSQIELQVRQYWLDGQETKKRVKVTEQSISQAEENLKVNRDRYENGLSTNTEVLDAETLRIRSLDNHANAIYDAVLANIRLKRAVSDL